MSSASQQADDKAKAFFGYGNDAAQKGNFVYAAQMYREACKLKPDNLIYRQSLRGAQRRKFNNEPSKVGRMVGLKLSGLWAKIKLARNRQKWAEVLDMCEECFEQSPWDLGASISAAEAAQNLGFKKLAQYYIEAVTPQGEKDESFLRSGANFLEFADEYQKAIWFWEKLKTLVPTDEEARKKVNDLTAKSAIKKSGLQESIDKHQGKVGSSGPEKELPPDAEELRGGRMTTEQRLVKEIEEMPDRIGPYLSLADHYKHEGKLKEAEDILAKGMKANPTDDYLIGSYAEVQMSRLRVAIDAYTKKVAREPLDPEPKEKLEQLKDHLYRYELKELRRKVGLKPEEYKLRMQLGQKYAEGGKHDEAIAEFQQVRNSAELKVQALLYAGLSFKANGVMKLAERNFEDALRQVDGTKEPAIFMELHYNLGQLSEEQGNKAIAEEHYNEVAALDYSFKDVANRLRKLGEKPPVED